MNQVRRALFVFACVFILLPCLALAAPVREVQPAQAPLISKRGPHSRTWNGVAQVRAPDGTLFNRVTEVVEVAS